MNWNGCGRKQSLPNFKVLSRHLAGGSEDTMISHGQDSRSPGRDLSPGPLEHEAGVSLLYGIT
jgi:hypothetical protein